MEVDPAWRRCVGRIHQALDLLEADPGDVRNRRRRFMTIDLWASAVFCDDSEWLILWEPGDGEDVVVHHIVKAP